MGKITSMHFAGWKMGLKTGMYYLRTMAASAPIQFTVDQEQLKVADTNVARETTSFKKRVGGGASSAYSAVPRGENGHAEQEVPRATAEAPATPNGGEAEQGSQEDGEQAKGDIYSQQVLQCSIENKEACIMCQG